MKNTWKMETSRDFTAWDLNCRHVDPHKKKHNNHEKKFRRKNRRKVKMMLDILVQTCYNTIRKKKGEQKDDDLV